MADPTNSSENTAQLPLLLWTMIARLMESGSETRHELEICHSELVAIVEHANDAIYSHDLTGKIRTWNPGAERLYGYSAAEAIGRPVIDLILHPNSQLSNLFENLGTDLFVQRVHKDGRIVDVALRRSAIYDNSGKVTGISVIARDVTAEKAAERRISDFYSTVSHELRTPLTSIKGALSLIQNGGVPADSPQASKLISVANSSTERLVRLINNFLDMRKIEAGMLEIRMYPIDSKELINEVVQAMSPYAAQQRIRLKVQTAGSSLVLGDKDRLTQVLTNLIGNAIKFSEPDSDIEIRTVRDSLLVRFEVQDHGPGIPQHQHHKIFERFQQVDSSDSRQNEGSGLGLAISKGIVEQHNGRIGFNSRPEYGSTFWFELPEVSEKLVRRCG